MTMTADDVMDATETETGTTEIATEETETEIMTVETGTVEGTTATETETTVVTGITETIGEVTEEVDTAEIETTTVAEALTEASRCSVQEMRIDHPLQREQFQSQRGSVSALDGISKLLASRTLLLCRQR